MSYSLAEPSIVDKAMQGEVKLNLENIKVKEEESWTLASELLRRLAKYDVEVVDINNNYPVIIVYLNKFLIIIVPLGKRLSVTGELSLKIFQKILEIIKNIRNNRKIVVIYFSPGGKLLLSAYLFLGYLIEKHDVGILFVNGGIDEVLEVIEKLAKKGSFAPEEEDYVDLKAIG